MLIYKNWQFFKSSQCVLGGKNFVETGEMSNFKCFLMLLVGY